MDLTVFKKIILIKISYDIYKTLLQVLWYWKQPEILI